MRSVLIVLIGLFFCEYCYCQIDCKIVLKNYPNTIDTSKRPVYLFVENMPDIVTGSKLMDFFAKKVHLVESSKCFPIYIFYGFVVEADCSISNVMICPTLMFCDDNEKIDLIEQKYIKQLTSEVIKIKTDAGLLNGKKVAVYTFGRIHFDPQ
ncbi:hypothetical protein [Williamwhitmania taraxaci]|uniref:Uncharacterized protein n=1 Tax=Williamwhitmania taraxaci TaxID=1640674 RepID=A0A1G6SUV5_9BACT|nr:hypothetical protein [Williamwhitmania taraxaci]SDD20730.1 hypothetical protein SAMN05216323_11035 [Williamwhitmania taraxaci]